MIELRWVHRTFPLPGQDSTSNSWMGYGEKVLQYRFDISATQGVWMVNPDHRMSEWKDVPTVTHAD